MSTGTTTGPTRGLWQRLRGPRYVDPPQRVIIAVLAVATVMAPAVHQPVLLLAQILSGALLLVAIFLPTTAMLLGTGAHLFWMLALPQYQSTFEIVIYACIGILFSYLRWIRGSAGVVIIVGANILGQIVEYPSNNSFIAVVLLTIIAATLGISSGLFERNLGREITRREHSALEAGQRMERMRQRIAIDAHDTLSHSLNTESSILTTILHTSDLPPQVQGPLTELYVVNSEAQVLLRGLLSRLSEAERHGERHDDSSADRPASGGGSAAVPIDLAGELARIVRTIGAATAASAVDLRITLGDFAVLTTPEFAAQCQLLLRELTTNIIKHGRRDGSSSISIDLDERWSSGPWLHLTSTNAVGGADGAGGAPSPAGAGADPTVSGSAPTGAAEIRPRSIDLRTRELGGTVEVSATSAGILTVRVSLPIPAVPDGPTASSPGAGPTTPPETPPEEAR